jgi:putative transposase
MKASRFREEQIIAVSHEHEAGAKTAEVGRRHGISDATFYIYGRLPRIKRFGFCSDENRLQTSIRRHHLTARPNGKSSHSPGTIGWQIVIAERPPLSVITRLSLSITEP